MTKTVNRIRKNGHVYYTVIDQKWVNGKLVRKYVGYIGKSPAAKTDITGGEIMKYVERLIKANISDSEISDILEDMGIHCDISPITKIILENDRKLGRVFLRLR